MTGHPRIEQTGGLGDACLRFLPVSQSPPLPVAPFTGRCDEIDENVFERRTDRGELLELGAAGADPVHQHIQVRHVAGGQVEVAVDAIDGRSGRAQVGQERVVHPGRDELVARGRGRQVVDLSFRRDGALPQHGDPAAHALDFRKQV
jgi:hypothetical protein